MKTAYWASTSLVAVLLAVSAYTYFFHLRTIEGVRDLGFPDFFRIQLGVLKVLAAFVILLPAMPLPAKDWAYAGIVLFLLTAIVAHWAHRDPVALLLVNVLVLGLVVMSRVFLEGQGG